MIKQPVYSDHYVLKSKVTSVVSRNHASQIKCRLPAPLPMNPMPLKKFHQAIHKDFSTFPTITKSTECIPALYFFIFPVLWIGSSCFALKYSMKYHSGNKRTDYIGASSSFGLRALMSLQSEQTCVRNLSGWARRLTPGGLQ